MPLKQHRYYVYHEENRVMARMEDLPPVVAEECDTPQAAHDKVQSVVNPQGLKHDDPSLCRVTSETFVCPETGEEKEREVKTQMGFLHPDFQYAISDNCKDYVVAAYKKAKWKKKPVTTDEQ